MTTLVLKNLRQLFHKNAVARTEKRRSCQKYDEDFFQILWPFKKTQTLPVNSSPNCHRLQSASHLFGIHRKPRKQTSARPEKQKLHVSRHYLE